ncbi:MAG: isoprenylcysteine carboxylmethyltransferase family protein [Microcella sp.]|uniref:methyltransferase family protein n=1 Tax=Microcella sp. TaxID=1913979 RepID=UPI003314C7B0
MSTTRTLHPAAAWSLVGAQFVLLMLLGFLPWGSLWQRGIDALVVGLTLVALGGILAVVAGTGLGRALTPTPVPRDSAELTTTGIYGLVRHPLYSGLLVLGAGLVVIGASWLHVLAWVALLVLLAAKARLEEWMLLERHDEYAQYAARVGRLVPGVGRIRP